MIHNTVKKQCGLNFSCDFSYRHAGINSGPDAKAHGAQPASGLAVKGGGGGRGATAAAGAVDEEFVDRFRAGRA